MVVGWNQGLGWRIGTDAGADRADGSPAGESIAVVGDPRAALGEATAAADHGLWRAAAERIASGILSGRLDPAQRDALRDES